jgi:CheY-like chemotaxis protein
VLRKSKGLQANVIEGIDVIERNAKTQAKLVDDLLDLHGIASGKLRLELVDVDLVSVVTMAVAAIRPAAEGKGLTLTCTTDCPGTVRGDPERLQQVVSNLLANSVKFTPSGGSITVTLSRKDEWAEIAFADTGQGISPEHLTEIFDRFRQADSSTTRKHGGLGIGLSLVRQLVALHGGRVRAESEGEGHGSKFVVELPMTTRAEVAEDVTGAVSTRIAGSHVLVVDDEPDGLEATRLLLEESGAVVATASSASEALDRLEHESFDAILSDIGMPETDGYAFMAEVRRRGIDTPAGALTALTREEDRNRAFEAGYSAHVPKPIDPPTLLATVRSLAASH